MNEIYRDFSFHYYLNIFIYRTVKHSKTTKILSNTNKDSNETVLIVQFQNNFPYNYNLSSGISFQHFFFVII